MILRDKKNHMILWCTKCTSWKWIEWAQNRERVERKWAIGNKTQIKRHYRHGGIEYTRMWTITQKHRILRLDFSIPQCSSAQTIRLFMMVMAKSFDMCHFYMDKISPILCCRTLFHLDFSSFVFITRSLSLTHPQARSLTFCLFIEGASSSVSVSVKSDDIKQMILSIFIFRWFDAVHQYGIAFRFECSWACFTAPMIYVWCAHKTQRSIHTSSMGIQT